jgi:hypothetical protein
LLAKPLITKIDHPSWTRRVDCCEAAPEPKQMAWHGLPSSVMIVGALAARRPGRIAIDAAKPT